MAVRLEDLAGDDRPVNLPSTADEYPNWRPKLPGTMDEITTAIREYARHIWNVAAVPVPQGYTVVFGGSVEQQNTAFGQLVIDVGCKKVHETMGRMGVHQGDGKPIYDSVASITRGMTSKGQARSMLAPSL